jgi:Uma2 family endonuclease
MRSRGVAASGPRPTRRRASLRSMSTVGVHPPGPVSRGLSPVRQRRFSVAEYQRMIEAGILGEDEHVELLEGEIVQMPPQDPPHAQATHRLNRFFVRRLGDEYIVRPQLPLTLRRSEPEPDVAIVRAQDEASARSHPRTALLVVEVADSSVRYDLDVKARIYARAGIPEYWLVVVPKRCIEVLRGPDVRAGVYRHRSTFAHGQVLRPLRFPKLMLRVRSLFD